MELVLYLGWSVFKTVWAATFPKILNSVLENLTLSVVCIKARHQLSMC